MGRRDRKEKPARDEAELPVDWGESEAAAESEAGPEEEADSPATPEPLVGPGGPVETGAPEFAGAGESASADDAAEALEDEAVEEFAVDVETLVAELEDLRDRHLRLAAEFDNYRRRTRREHAELASSAQAELARRLLPTLDDLARVAATPTEATSVEALEKGMDLILRNLSKELGEAGLTRIEALDAPFDPQLHQAIMLVDCAEPHLDETVSRVFVDGYRYGDRLIRPAQVEVRRHVPDVPAANDESEQAGTD